MNLAELIVDALLERSGSDAAYIQLHDESQAMICRRERSTLVEIVTQCLDDHPAGEPPTMRQALIRVLTADARECLLTDGFVAGKSAAQQELREALGMSEDDAS